MLLRDILHPELVSDLSMAIHGVWPDFDESLFLGKIIPALAEKGLSERAALIAEALEYTLPKDYPTALAIVVRALPPETGVGALQGNDKFLIWGLTLFVSRNGTAPEHLDWSLEALYEMTKRFTAEWDIRVFLEMYPEATLERLAHWANDPNEHVRRLVSEGTRPRLPWGRRLKAFQADPRPVLPLLRALANDPSEYVRRSVANHLNDIAKDHPALVVETLAAWQNEQPGSGLDKLRRHALRTLVKQGHPEALALLGAGGVFVGKIVAFSVSPARLSIGEKLHLKCILKSTAETQQHLVVDYGIGFRKANGSAQTKVFKWKTFDIAAGETLEISGMRTLAHFTTRKMYPGLHEVFLQVNGERVAGESFWVG